MLHIENPNDFVQGPGDIWEWNQWYPIGGVQGIGVGRLHLNMFLRPDVKKQSRGPPIYFIFLGQRFEPLRGKVFLRPLPIYV